VAVGQATVRTFHGILRKAGLARRAPQRQERCNATSPTTTSPTHPSVSSAPKARIDRCELYGPRSEKLREFREGIARTTPIHGRFYLRREHRGIAPGRRDPR